MVHLYCLQAPAEMDHCNAYSMYVSEGVTVTLFSEDDYVGTPTIYQHGEHVLKKNSADTSQSFSSLKVNGHPQHQCCCDQCRGKPDRSQKRPETLLVNTKQYNFGESPLTRKLSSNQVSKPAVMIKMLDERTGNILGKTRKFEESQLKKHVDWKECNVNRPQLVTVRAQCRCEKPVARVADHMTGKIEVTSDLYEAELTWSNTNVDLTRQKCDFKPVVFYLGYCQKEGAGVVFQQIQDQPNPDFTIIRSSLISVGSKFALPKFKSDFWRVKVRDGLTEYDAVHVDDGSHAEGVLYVLKAPTKVVLYEHSNYEGWAARVGIGKYTLQALQAKGVVGVKVASLYVPEGWTVTVHGVPHLPTGVGGLANAAPDNSVCVLYVDGAHGDDIPSRGSANAPLRTIAYAVGQARANTGVTKPNFNLAHGTHSLKAIGTLRKIEVVALHPESMAGVTLYSKDNSVQEKTFPEGTYEPKCIKSHFGKAGVGKVCVPEGYKAKVYKVQNPAKDCYIQGQHPLPDIRFDQVVLEVIPPRFDYRDAVLFDALQELEEPENKHLSNKTQEHVNNAIRRRSCVKTQSYLGGTPVSFTADSEPLTIYSMARGVGREESQTSVQRFEVCDKPLIGWGPSKCWECDPESNHSIDNVEAKCACDYMVNFNFKPSDQDHELYLLSSDASASNQVTLSGPGVGTIDVEGGEPGMQQASNVLVGDGEDADGSIWAFVCTKSFMSGTFNFSDLSEKVANGVDPTEQACSINVPEGMSATVYADDNCGGKNHTYHAGMHTLKARGARSLKVSRVQTISIVFLFICGVQLTRILCSVYYRCVHTLRGLRVCTLDKRLIMSFVRSPAQCTMRATSGTGTI